MNSPPAAIEVAGLTKVYGRQQVVDNVSFTVRPGSVTGFLGPNGAGKPLLNCDFHCRGGTFPEPGGDCLGRRCGARSLETACRCLIG
jgi:ABC-type lipopolysaccharide export system ATPase subunit